MFNCAITTINRSTPTVPVFSEDVWGPPRKIRTKESIVPDTDIPLTVLQMAELFKRIGTPAPEKDAELSVDPDDYPLL